MFMLTAEFFWKLFESTGSVAAYLLYKCLCSYHN
ncbi:MAG: YqzL family protein [Firmicutes bacterium]|nr:YqzL family protein [Bacillota bacterium]